MGGARSDRRKWLHCFEDLSTTIFCLSLAGMCGRLAEDPNTGDWQEGKTLLAELAGSRWIANSNIIVVLTGLDLFELLVPQYAELMVLHVVVASVLT